MNQRFQPVAYFAWCFLPIVVNDIVQVCVCVRWFSCFLYSEKMRRINLEQIKVYKVHVRAKHFECQFHSAAGGLTSSQVGWWHTKTNIQTGRQNRSPYPGRQTPQTASEVTLPGVATSRPRILQEACGRQSSVSSVSEKLPTGHGLHWTSSVGLWICPHAWQERRKF